MMGSQKRVGRAREAAFTLIEVLLATVLAAIVLAAVAGICVAARDASRSVRKRADERARFRSVLTRIELDLQALLPPGGVHASGLVGEDASRERAGDLSYPEAEENARVEASRLDIDPPPYEARDRLVMAIAPHASRFGRVVPIGEGALPEITYEVDDDEETEERGLLRTVTRIREPLPNAEEPVPEELCPYVTGFDVEFFDGSAWQTSWDSGTTETLPAAIKVTLSVIHEDGRLRRVSLTVAPLTGREVTSLLPSQEGGG